MGIIFKCAPAPPPPPRRWFGAIGHWNYHPDGETPPTGGMGGHFGTFLNVKRGYLTCSHRPSPLRVMGFDTVRERGVAAAVTQTANRG